MDNKDKADQTQNAGAARQGGITSIEGLTLYGWDADGMEVDNAFGHYYKKVDVERLISAGSTAASLARQSQAAQPPSQAAFEAWALVNGFKVERRNDADSPDTYFRHETEQRWIVWQAAHIAGTSQAAKAQADGEITAKLNAAVDAEYPLPDTPHTSVKMQWVDNRAAMWRGINAARKILAPVAKEAPVVPELTVWYGPMPESNGASNFTATLMRKGASMFDTDSYTFARSEYPDRVRYEADSMRYLIGELTEKPCILDYDADKHSSYVEPVASVAKEATRDAESVQALPGLYEAALLAVERMRGCAATYIEDHARDSYPGQIGLRPQDVAMMWAQEIHGIDAKVYLDEAIADIATTTSTVSAPDSALPVLLKLLDRLDKERRRTRHTPGTGQHHAYLDADEVAARVEEARKALAEGAQKAPEEVRNQALLDAITECDLVLLGVDTPEESVGALSCRDAIRALRTSSTDQANADTGSAA